MSIVGFWCKFLFRGCGYIAVKATPQCTDCNWVGWENWLVDPNPKR